MPMINRSDPAFLNKLPIIVEKITKMASVHVWTLEKMNHQQSIHFHDHLLNLQPLSNLETFADTSKLNLQANRLVDYKTKSVDQAIGIIPIRPSVEATPKAHLNSAICI
ncbi:hypothetical protein GOBAR_DD15944 [Gossypium barbadense]|nr:hypothetical protein GOBAR_DD15944 [Gossypium barbadense]